MLFKTSLNQYEKAYDERARNIMVSVREEEKSYDPMPKFSDDFVRMNVIHTRQDVILLVSHLSSANKQLHIINDLLGYVVCLLFAILIAIIFSFTT